MQNNIAIKLSDLNKIYKLYRHPGDALLESVLKKPRHREILVLDRISLNIYKGQVLGILGRNGAGKSTLLKLIAGVLSQSSGEVSVDGKITAILELGTGFHDQGNGSHCDQRASSGRVLWT